MAYIDIDSDDLLYDRTRNFSGVTDYEGISDITCPTEGSNVEFLAKDKALTTNNNWLNIMPVGINNVYANYRMVYEAKEEDARKLANFFESKRGIDPILFDTDPTVYKPVNGYCSEYSVTQLDVDTFKISALFEVTESPGHLNWTGLNFLYVGEESIYYVQENKKYEENDIAYDQRLEFEYQDRLNNFYYCTEDHDSSQDTSTSLEDSPYWTRDFFWQPDVGQSATVPMETQRFGDSDGFPYRRKVKDNSASFPLQYNFSEISTKQLKSMLHFLESKNGYKRFKHRINTVFNRPKVYVCRKWTHTWNSFDSHNLDLKLDEDPFGVVPDRVKHSEETLSSRAFGGDDNLLAQASEDIPPNWFELDPDIFDLKIGAGCKFIGESAFESAPNLQGLLNIPGSVTGIGDDAFNSCAGLNNSLILGGGILELGARAFYNCGSMTGPLLLPPNIRYVGDEAFSSCDGFDEDLGLGESLTGLGDSVFMGCVNINSKIAIPPTLKEIPYQTFRGCVNLYGDLDIPSGVEVIGEQAFWNCKRIGTDVNFPSTIKTIQNNAFRACDKVYNIYINAPLAPNIVGEPFPLSTMRKLRKIHVPIGAEGYDTAYWQAKDSAGKLVFDIVL
jgi:phage-related protein